MVSDPGATSFPNDGIDILLGPDVGKHLADDFQSSQCKRAITLTCQENILAVLNTDDSVELQARQIPSIGPGVKVIGLYFSYLAHLWARIQEDELKIHPAPRLQLSALHYPKADHYQIASCQGDDSPDRAVFATTVGDIHAVTVTLTAIAPPESATMPPPTWTKSPEGQRRSLRAMLMSGHIWTQLWRSLLILGDIPFDTLPPNVQDTIDSIKLWSESFRADFPIEKVDRIIIALSGVVSRRMGGRPIDKVKVYRQQQDQKQKEEADKKEKVEEEEKKKQCPPDDRTPFCANCGGDGISPFTFNTCPGDPQNNNNLQGCKCLPRGDIRAFNPYGSLDAALLVWQSIFNTKTISPPVPVPAPPPPPSSPSPPPPPPPLPAPSLSGQTCYQKADFSEPGTGDIDSKAQNAYSRQFCKDWEDQKMTSTSPALKRNPKDVSFSSTNPYKPYHFTISWIKDCQTAAVEQSVQLPLGPEHALGANCELFVRENFLHCNNGGVGGYRDAGCLRYSLSATRDIDAA
ncbi:hypothetical protein HYALB_00001809 [Hymenoscyphus albidus]|uniref:Uncharacterized protein n=1 Tax=Hymenoscyphus albidus TaxID=595503 RepID=A0A9N9LMK7_9HELO|nr:hypothetical protein HYALB_00001809 [Hymenoscyphus albidus]